MSLRCVHGVFLSVLLLSSACARSVSEAGETGESGDGESGAVDESGSSSAADTHGEWTSTDGDAGEVSSSSGGDGDAGDGDGDAACEPGTEGCECFPNDTCFDPLVCEGGICVSAFSGSDQSCCDWHDGGGCVDAEVEACVCQNDEFCCNNHWDTLCVFGAENCGGACNDGAGDHANGDNCAYNGDCESGWCYYDQLYAAVCMAECMPPGGGGEDGPLWCIDDSSCCSGSCMMGGCMGG